MLNKIKEQMLKSEKFMLAMCNFNIRLLTVAFTALYLGFLLTTFSLQVIIGSGNEIFTLIDAYGSVLILWAYLYYLYTFGDTLLSAIQNREAIPLITYEDKVIK